MDFRKEENLVQPSMGTSDDPIQSYNLVRDISLHTCVTPYGVLDLREILMGLKPGLLQLISTGYIDEFDSIGCAMAFTEAEDWCAHFQQVWDKPKELIACATGFGPRAIHYMRNAIGKIRPMARTGFPTNMILACFPELWQNMIRTIPDVPEDQNTPCVDFGWPGGVIIQYEGFTALFAVSALAGFQDAGVGDIAGLAALRRLHALKLRARK